MRAKSFFLVSCLLAAVLVGCGNAQRKNAVVPVRQQFINIAAGDAAEIYRQFCGVLAEILNKNVPGLNAAVEMTGASADSIALLAAGKAELTVAKNDVAYYAVSGTEMFYGKKTGNLRGICALYPETLHIVALESSGIKKVSDIRGKRAAVDIDAGAAARNVLAAYAVPEKSVQIQYLNYTEAAKELIEGKADVLFITAAYPAAIIKETARKVKLLLIPIDENKIGELLRKHPFYGRQTIPAGAYNGQAKPVPAVSVASILLASDRIGDEMGYKIAKAMYDNLQKLRGVHPAANSISKHNAFSGMTVPFNAGAEKFFKE